MIHHIVDLVHLTTLNDGARPGYLSHRCVQCFTAIQHIQARHIEIHSALLQISEELFDHGCILRRSASQRIICSATCLNVATARCIKPSCTKAAASLTGKAHWIASSEAFAAERNFCSARPLSI